MILTALALAATFVGDPDPSTMLARAVCSAPLGSEPSAPDVEVVAFPAVGGELAGLRVRHQASGAWMNVYYDPASEAAARSRAACFGVQLKLIHDLTQDDRAGVQWHSVAFSAAPDTVKTDSSEMTRWVVPTQDGALGDDGDQVVLVVLPHEQIHAFQMRAGATTPRWFREGNAEWLGRQVTAVISPDWEARTATRRAGDLAASTQPVALGGWGGVAVKREAILRQASPEDRAKMEADPSFTPDGAFHFGPDDVVADESNTPARYAAAWTVYRDMETATSVQAVQAWFKGLTQASGRVASATVVETAKATLGFDLAPRLQ